MRKTVLSLALALLFGAVIVLLSQGAGVGAVGPPSDNSTLQNLPLSEQAQNEIKPSVKYALLGPSSQTKSTPPNVMPRFLDVLEQEKVTITGQESWYLHVDINAPGWLYIYEYFPTGEKVPGRWIAYKWQLPQNGVWKLGPFTAGSDEPEGQHTYRFWFYSDGLWAGDDARATKAIVASWTYLKGQPADKPSPPLPPPSPASTKEASFFEQLRSFFSQPTVLVLVPLVGILAIVCFYGYRWYTGRKRIEDTAMAPLWEEPENAFAVVSLAVPGAAIVLPNGVELKVIGSGRIIGRGDLARALDLDILGLVSRRHFAVKAEGAQFYIEDLNSANGTRVNGLDISGKGAVSLNADDTIEPAGAIQLTFRVLCPVKVS